MIRSTARVAVAVAALIAPLTIVAPAAAQTDETVAEGTLLGDAEYALRL